MSEFVTYEKFATIGELKEFVELLQENNIPYELEEDVPLFDASFANISHHRDYRIQLLTSTTVNSLILITKRPVKLRSIIFHISWKLLNTKCSKS